MVILKIWGDIVGYIFYVIKDVYYLVILSGDNIFKVK